LLSNRNSYSKQREQVMGLAAQLNTVAQTYTNTILRSFSQFVYRLAGQNGQ